MMKLARFLNEGVKSAKEKSLKVDYIANLNLLGQLQVLQKNYTKAKPTLEETIKASREMGKYNTLVGKFVLAGYVIQREQTTCHKAAIT
jgi:uncharacterized protein HemY